MKVREFTEVDSELAEYLADLLEQDDTPEEFKQVIEKWINQFLIS